MLFLNFYTDAPAHSFVAYFDNTLFTTFTETIGSSFKLLR